MEYRGHEAVPSHNPLGAKSAERINEMSDSDPSLTELLHLKGPFEGLIQSLTPLQQQWVAHEILALGLDATDFEFEREAEEVVVIADALREFVSIDEPSDRKGLAKEIFRMLRL